MERSNNLIKKIGNLLSGWPKKTLFFLGKRFLMISLIVGAFFCVFVWYRFIFKADWSEAKKQSYIDEQAKFSFDKAGYQKMVDMMKNRRVKFESFPSYTGRDIFFPEGQ